MWPAQGGLETGLAIVFPTEEPGSCWPWSTITYALLDAITYKLYNLITYDIRDAIPYEWHAAPLTLDGSDGNAAGKTG